MILHMALALVFSSPSEPNSCPPGWRGVNDSCFQLQIISKPNWDGARLECHNRGGRLAVLEDGVKPGHTLTNFIDEYMDEWEYFYVGAYAVSDGRWITVNNQPFSTKSSLWGPAEPSGDGGCADLIFAEKWNPNWKGKGWRVNDQPCITKQGFVCQKQKDASGNVFKNAVQNNNCIVS